MRSAFYVDADGLTRCYECVVQDTRRKRVEREIGLLQTVGFVVVSGSKVCSTCGRVIPAEGE